MRLDDNHFVVTSEKTDSQVKPFPPPLTSAERSPENELQRELSLGVDAHKQGG